MNNLDPLAYNNPHLMIGNEEKSLIIVPPVILITENRHFHLSYCYELSVNSNFYSLNEKEREFTTQLLLYKELQSYENIKFSELNTDSFSKWDALRNVLADRLNKKTANEIIQFLPALFNEQIKIKRLDVEDFYKGCASWLVHWDNNLDTSSLKESNWQWIEGCAVVAKRRYELIYELFNKKLVEKSIFLTPQYAWLMCETSILRRKIISTFSSREELYKNNKQYINELDLTYEGKLKTFKCGDENNQLSTYADQHFDYLGRKTAAEDCDFDKYYFQPYIIALRRWNTYTRKNLELSPTDGRKPSKPGKKLGQINR
ncbi:hypothetical protein [Nostoc sp. FACHB-133]|uniref:hypothetical protein n=1 Tax=Nostoc sp. FACHB-133 TaxID=2692835 RepID=UPI0016822BDF|nr:hypothetical protein [Nostoc sp. FACHB-133]MBD2527457.1 hypothetical protein [Nostoc sp. FACHB-133]